MARIKYYDSESQSWKYADMFGAAGITPVGIGAITSPSVAEVGQSIVVSSVDENGKPILWTAETLATKNYVDTMFNDYITEIDSLIGGDS